MKKEELIEAIKKELMSHYPEGTQWRESTAEQQAKALIEKFDIKGLKKCQKKDS